MAATRKGFLYFGGANRVNPTNSETNLDLEEAEIWDVVEPGDRGKRPLILKNERMMKNSDDEDDRRSGSVASLPLKIPDWSEFKNMNTDSRDKDDEEYGAGQLPPHEYLARRNGSSFSVYEGIGRTLKGRDMSRVRNSVWKQTGFED